MAHAHFKDKLLADLVDKSPPFRCPAQDCSYQTRERDKWSRHYGSVHGLIKKYLKQYWKENPEKSPMITTSPTSLNASKEDSFTTIGDHADDIRSFSKEPRFLKDQKVKERYILKVI